MRSKSTVDLLAAGLPCPPFSIAGKKLGNLDERNLFPAALDIVEVVRPRAVMIENVRGILDAVFEDFRRQVRGRLESMIPRGGVGPTRRVPQSGPVLWQCLGRRSGRRERHRPTVGETLAPLMKAGWRGATAWRKQADEIAPTIVGGSKSRRRGRGSLREESRSQLGPALVALDRHRWSHCSKGSRLIGRFSGYPGTSSWQRCLRLSLAAVASDQIGAGCRKRKSPC